MRRLPRLVEEGGGGDKNVRQKTRSGLSEEKNIQVIWVSLKALADQLLHWTCLFLSSSLPVHRAVILARLVNPFWVCEREGNGGMSSDTLNIEREEVNLKRRLTLFGSRGASELRSMKPRHWTLRSLLSLAASPMMPTPTLTIRGSSRKARNRGGGE